MFFQGRGGGGSGGGHINLTPALYSLFSLLALLSPVCLYKLSLGRRTRPLSPLSLFNTWPSVRSRR